MTNSEITNKFFSVITMKAQGLILANIAAHYGITTQEALLEVTDPEAESLLDYITGSERGAVSILMQAKGIRRFAA